MKLYTEEQVSVAINAAKANPEQAYLIQAMLTPIELPSDEEIDIYVKSTGYYGHCTTEYREGIEEGAKWMRNKIQGGKQ